MDRFQHYAPIPNNIIAAERGQQRLTLKMSGMVSLTSSDFVSGRTYIFSVTLSNPEDEVPGLARQSQ